MAKEIVEEDLLSGPSTTRPFADLFLLALIDAHAEKDATPLAWSKARERRLAVAKIALFGEPSARGPKQVDDRAALYWMGREHYRDLALVSMVKMGLSKGADVRRAPLNSASREGCGARRVRIVGLRDDRPSARSLR